MSLLRNCTFDAKSLRPLISQFREKPKWRELFSPRILCGICAKPFGTSTPKLVKYSGDTEWTNPNFSERLKESFHKPETVLIGLKNFAGEFGKLYKERRENSFFRKETVKDPRREIDMLYTFDSDEQFNNFMVLTDSSQHGGYSSASLKMTPTKTGLFSGCISTEPVKDGETNFTGYATMLTRKRLRSFKRIKHLDFSSYTHLVFKVRGDGRTYYVHFSVEPLFKGDQSWVFSYPLFTRGGPHWQVSKIAFSDFFFISNGQMPFHQSDVRLKTIMTLGLTTRQIEGPYKLEIDYIGLEKKVKHREISPYESYT